MADWSGSEEGREEHERGAGAGERRKSEEEVFTLLFREVDREDRGEVSVEALIEYLQRMQLGRDQTEEVSDSTADVYCVRYNLQLLKTMLEESSRSSGLVNLDTYSRVIRLWVKDIRDRSSQQSLEVSLISSDSEEEEEDGEDENGGDLSSRTQLSYGGDQSFETCGGNSSTHSAQESMEVLASLEDLRVENRRLAERERQLQASLDQSEDQLRSLQTEKSALLSQLNNAQQQLGRVEVMERENSAIALSLREEEGKCHTLEAAAASLRSQLAEAEEELERLRQRVTESESERATEAQDIAALQKLLTQKEEALEEEVRRMEQLQTQLSDVNAASNSLRSKVVELEEGNAVLQRENEELHSATLPSGPAYSTPYRSTGPPSLHDEISRRGNLSDRVLPSPLVDVDHHGNSMESLHMDSTDPALSFSHDGHVTSTSLEDLERLARNSSNKFHSKTEIIVKLLSDLLSTSNMSTHSSESITETSRSRQASKNMRQLVICVKKLYKDKKELKSEIERLQAQLKVKEEVDAAVQTVAIPPGNEAPPPGDETVPPVAAAPAVVQPQPQPQPRAVGTSCFGLVGGVVRGVIWGLTVSFLLLLLFAVFVWLHQHLTPCCHGNAPLTPGGIAWAVFEPLITVSHHGHI